MQSALKQRRCVYASSYSSDASSLQRAFKFRETLRLAIRFERYAKQLRNLRGGEDTPQYGFAALVLVQHNRMLTARAAQGRYNIADRRILDIFHAQRADFLACGHNLFHANRAVRNLSLIHISEPTRRTP